MMRLGRPEKPHHTEPDNGADAEDKQPIPAPQTDHYCTFMQRLKKLWSKKKSVPTDKH